MLKRALDWFRVRITVRTALLLLGSQIVISVLLFNVGWVPQLRQTSGLDLMDVRFGYSADALYPLLGQYGERGRELYRAYLLYADFLYGVLSALTFAAVLAAASKLSLPYVHYLIPSIMLPFLLFVLNLVENLGLLWVLSRFPEPNILAASMAGLATSLKLILVYLVMALVVVSLVLMAVAHYRTRRVR